MVFPGLMAMSVVRWIVGALELLQEQHLVRVTLEHLQRALDDKMGKLFKLISSPIPDSFFISPLSKSKAYRMAKLKNCGCCLPKK